MNISKPRSFLKRAIASTLVTVFALPAATAAMPLAASAGVEYDLYIDGVRVTSANASDVLKNGVFSYNASSNKLTIDGDYEFSDTAIESDITNLVVDTISNSTLTCPRDGFSLGKYTVFTGKGILNVESTSSQYAYAAIYQRNNCRVVFNDMTANLTGPCGIWGTYEEDDSYSTVEFKNSYVTVSGRQAFESSKNIILSDNCYIYSPETYRFDPVDGTIQVKHDGTWDAAETVKISGNGQCYGLKIAGVPVTDYNCSDILGDGVFEYLPDSKTLIVNGDCSSVQNAISADYYNNNYDVFPLTIDVQGLSELTSTKHAGIVISGGKATITGRSSLTVNADAAGILINDSADLYIHDAALYVNGRWGITGSDGSNNTEEQLFIDYSYVDVMAEDGKPAISDMRRQGTTLAAAAFTDSDLTYKYEGDGESEYIGYRDGSYASHVTIQPDDSNLTVYDVEVDGIIVTSHNKYDIIGNGVFSYTTADDMLALTENDDFYSAAVTVKGSYKTIDDNMIANNSGEPLIVQTAYDSNLTSGGFYTIYSSEAPLYITNKYLSHYGTLTVESIYVNYADLTIENADLIVTGKNYGITGNINYKCKIVNSSVDAYANTPESPNDQGYSAINDFDELILDGGCYFAYPIDAVYADDRELVDGDGRYVRGVSIRVDKCHPIITGQTEEFYAYNGQTAEFKVIAKPYDETITNPNFTYQWQYYNMDTETWTDSVRPGAKTNTLSVVSDLAHDGYLYRCIINSPNGGAAVSQPAKLYYKTGIKTQPKDVSAAIGTDAKFTVAASTIGTPSYQWQYYNNNTKEWKDSTMTGYNTATLTVPITAARNGQRYRCVVSDKKGDTGFGTYTSNSASLFARAGFTKQPTNVSAAAGATAKFTATATGLGTLSYQWQYYDKGASKWINSGMTGATTATLSVPVTEARDGQKYRCVVKDKVSYNDGTSSTETITSNEVKLTVKPTITKQPANASGAVGSKAKFTVTASGAGTLTYQWQYYKKSSSTWENSTMTGAKTATLSVDVTEARNGQQYRCIVKSSNGSSVTSNVAKLTVTSGVSITKQPANVSAAVGATAKFTVTASGSGTLTYQWQYYDNGASKWINSGMTGATTATLSVPVTAARDGQKYRCIVKDSKNTATSSEAKLTVKAAITKQPANATAAAGSKAKFTVTASGSGTLTYQWQFFKKSSSTWENSSMTGAKTATLSVDVTEARDGQQYRCIVKSSNGTSVTSSVAKLTVKPTITKQPANVSAAAGAKAKFTVTASGAGTLSYQWQFFNKNANEWQDSGMTGAKTATLSVDATAARNGQQYRCIVKSSNGSSVTSSAATLTVK